MCVYMHTHQTLKTCLLVQFHAQMNTHLYSVCKGDNYMIQIGLLVLIDFNLEAQKLVTCGDSRMGVQKVQCESETWEYCWSVCMRMSAAAV